MQPNDNDQTETVFAAEKATLADASASIIWDRPSKRDADRSAEIVDALVVDDISHALQDIDGAGALRGSILHKLMEELLTGELGATRDQAAARAAELLVQLQPNVRDGRDEEGPHALEMAETALRTLALPELAPFLDQLVPEFRFGLQIRRTTSPGEQTRPRSRGSASRLSLTGSRT